MVEDGVCKYCGGLADSKDICPNCRGKLKLVQKLVKQCKLIEQYAKSKGSKTTSTTYHP